MCLPITADEDDVAISTDVHKAPSDEGAFLFTENAIIYVK